MTKPIDATLRAYQVGFGDCFLLTFHYASPETDRHLLIDFGSTGLPSGFPKNQMLKVAQDIATQCGGKLHGVVATHRHKDHISGFSTQGQETKEGKTTGDIIRELDPEIIIQPWTEEPSLRTDARAPQGLMSQEDLKANSRKAFAGTLRDMQVTALTVVKEAERLAMKHAVSPTQKVFLKPLDEKTAKQLNFLGENNLSNLSAVKNLQEMAKGKQADYVHYHYKLDLSKFFPGVTATILGPPTLEQYDEIARQRSADKDEFWMLRAIHKNYWGMQALTSKLLEDLNENNRFPNKIFPAAGVFKDYEPSETRWFTRRVRAIRADQLMGLVRILDDAMNNTSVIMVLEFGGKRLLFPGDAQIENWEYALKHADEKDANLKLLKGTTLYKVGHHGSRNATPKTLWETFGRKRPPKSLKDAVQTVVSTMAGKHGTTEATAVPRATLISALKENSQFHSTEEVTSGSVSPCIVIPI